MMGSDVTVKLSISAFLGFLIVGVVSAVLFAVAVAVGHGVTYPSTPEPVAVQAKPKYEPTISSVPLPQVNEAARNEIKQGWIFNRRPVVQVQQPCPTCPVAPDYIQPVPESRPVYPVPSKPAPQPNAVAQPSRIAPSDKPAQVSQRHEITVFLGHDAKSAEVASWFKSNPTLVNWRSACSYQEYFPESPLYQTLKDKQGRMLRDVVPVSQFPAVVVTDPDGAHIHAAGGNYLTTPEALIADVQLGNELAKQVKSQNNGLIRTAGYSWDTTVTPAMRLSAQDCPDGKCPIPTDSNSGWKPGKIINNLFDKPLAEKSSWVKDAMWGWLEIIVGGFVIVVIVTVLGGLYLAAFVLWMVKK